MKIEACAKINLTLDVTGIRDDGYHLVRMVMQSLSLHDVLTIGKIENDAIILTCDRQDLETDENNLVYKAAAMMKEEFGIREGVSIHLEKNIPLAAGLAGGSSDAAAALKGINDLFDLGLPLQKLMDLGVKIGADVPYCIMGHTALAEGIGEILTPLPPLEGICGILLAKPTAGVSTGGVYKALDALSGYEHPDTERMIRSIEEKDMKETGRLLCNVLENVTAVRNPLIGKLKDQMMECGALGSLMSGSGPTVFGIFENLSEAGKAGEYIKESGFNGDIITAVPM